MVSAQARLEAPRSAVTSAGRRPPRNLVAVLLSLVSGLGHIYLEHYLLGSLLFALFVCGLNGVFLASTLQTLERPASLFWSSLALLVTTWVGGLLHAWKLSFGTDRPGLERERVQLLRAGLLDYLRDDLEDASRKLARAVSLDVDWVDPDPLFHLGVVQVRLSERHAKRGDQAAARRARRLALGAFRKCAARDPAGKWRQELESEQRRLNRRLTGTGRMRALPPDVVESTEVLPAIAALGPKAAGTESPLPQPALAPRPTSQPGEAAPPRGAPTPAAGAPAVEPRSSGRFAALASPRGSGSFPALRSSGSLPAVRPAAGAPGPGIQGGAFGPGIQGGASGPGEGEAARAEPAAGSGERPTPARAPGRTSRRLLAKRLKKLLQEELGQELEEADPAPPEPPPTPPQVAVVVKPEEPPTLQDEDPDLTDARECEPAISGENQPQGQGEPAGGQPATPHEPTPDADPGPERTTDVEPA